jgi:hypothetical protein
MNRNLRGWAHELSVRGCHAEGFADLILGGRFTTASLQAAASSSRYVYRSSSRRGGNGLYGAGSATR